MRTLLELLEHYHEDGMEGDVEISFAHADSDSPRTIKVHSTLLALASPVFRGAFSCNSHESSSQASSSSVKTHHQIVVDEAPSNWLIVLARLYPLYPRQELTIEACKCILPIIHKYDIASLLSESLHILSCDLPSALDHKADSPGYVFTWLQLSDDLDLDEVRKLCMRKVRDLARFKHLEVAALLNIPGPSPISKPNYCQLNGVYSTSSQSGHTYGECVKWCGKCKRWGCGKSPCVGCGVTPSSSEAISSWFRSDQPELQPAVKGLSRETIEEVLAIVIAVNSDSYVHEERPQSAAAKIIY